MCSSQNLLLEFELYEFDPLAFLHFCVLGVFGDLAWIQLQLDCQMRLEQLIRVVVHRLELHIEALSNVLFISFRM